MMGSYEQTADETKKETKARLKLLEGGKKLKTEKQIKKHVDDAVTVCARLTRFLVTAFLTLPDLVKRACEEKRQELAAIASADVDGDLEQRLTEFHRAGEAREEFKRKEGIERDYEGPRNRESHLWLLGAYSAFEFAGAFWFLMQFASNVGLALAGAVIPTAITVVISFFATQAGRQWLRPGWARKVFAVVVSTSLVVLAALGQLGMAHGRDELITGQISASALFYRVLAGPMNLSSESWGFLFLSLLAFALCCREWLVTDDLHPGYGAKCRRVDEAEAAIGQKLVVIREKMTVAIQGKIQNLESIIRHNVKAANATLEAADSALIQLGITEPAAVDLEAETDPKRIVLLRGWKKSHALVEACREIGDVVILLSRRADEIDDDDPEPVAITHLSEAVRLEEARLWLKRYVDNFSISDSDEPDDDGEAF